MAGNDALGGRTYNLFAPQEYSEETVWRIDAAIDRLLEEAHERALAVAFEHLLVLHACVAHQDREAGSSGAASNATASVAPAIPRDRFMILSSSGDRDRHCAKTVLATSIRHHERGLKPARHLQLSMHTSSCLSGWMGVTGAAAVRIQDRPPRVVGTPCGTAGGLAPDYRGTGPRFSSAHAVRMLPSFLAHLSEQGCGVARRRTASRPVTVRVLRSILMSSA